MLFLNSGVVRAIPLPNGRLRFLMVSELLFNQVYFMRRERKHGLRYLFLDGFFVSLKLLHLIKIILIILLKDDIGLLFKNFHRFEHFFQAWAFQGTGPTYNTSPKVGHDGPRVIFLGTDHAACTNQGS